MSYSNPRFLSVFSSTRAVMLCILMPLLIIVGSHAHADESAESKPAIDIPEPTEFVSNHTGKFNGSTIKYTARAGETYLRTLKGEPKAAIFSFDYIKKDVADSSKRPVTFVWNGGPGSASTWLHMGTYGPKRVVVPSDADHAGSAPFEVRDADDTILDVTDLVFIDPVGTGYSRALGEHEGKEFWGLNEDAQSMSEFIRTWITDNGRWNSPRFLLGESFGTTRAAAVADMLHDDFNISLNGLIFVSQALDYAGSTPYVRHNITSYITYVPTMAATALYHDMIEPKPADRDVFIQESREFAVDELLPALFKGNTLDAETRASVIDRLAYFTGLSPAYIDRANLRINGFRFAKELLREQGIAVGLLDARYANDEADDLAASVEADSAHLAIGPAYMAALKSYLHSDLKVRWNRQYLSPADPELSEKWNWSLAPVGQTWEPKYVNTAPNLSDALRANPSMKVLVASGLYDLVTPFFDAEYTLNRHDIRAEQIEYKYYTGGHMMYVNEPARVELLRDSREFIKSQLR